MVSLHRLYRQLEQIVGQHREQEHTLGILEY
jgi:hypothetical protein